MNKKSRNIHDISLITGDIVPASTSDDELIALWLGNYRNAGTRYTYSIEVREFRAFAPFPLSQITLKHVQDFAASLAYLAAATQCKRLAAVKSLFKFAVRIGYLRWDVAAPLQAPAVKDTLGERIMSEEDTQRLLAGAVHPRDAALLRLIYSAGLRVSEVCGLHWRDCVKRESGGQITVFGKGGKTRSILIPEPMWKRLVAIRNGARREKPVFRTKNGKRALTRFEVIGIVKNAAFFAGLPSNISPHWLRHAHVSHALSRGAPVHVVRETVGHASLTTTTRYSHARPDDSSSNYLAT
jgi:integrase/recombinase XerD